MHRPHIQQSQMRRTSSRFGLLDNIVRKTYICSCFFVSVVMRAVLPQKKPLFGMHTGKCLHRHTAAVSLTCPMSYRYPAMSRFVFLCVSNFMRQWCVTAVTKTPRCCCTAQVFTEQCWHSCWIFFFLLPVLLFRKSSHKLDSACHLSAKQNFIRVILNRSGTPQSSGWEASVFCFR